MAPHTVFPPAYQEGSRAAAVVLAVCVVGVQQQEGTVSRLQFDPVAYKRSLPAPGPPVQPLWWPGGYWKGCSPRKQY